VSNSKEFIVTSGTGSGKSLTYMATFLTMFLLWEILHQIKFSNCSLSHERLDQFSIQGDWKIQKDLRRKIQ
jgi:hypothetical protein